MTRFPLIAAVALVAACTAAQDAAITKGLATQPGALFCSIQMAGGGSFVATLTAAALSNAVPAAGPLIVIATGAGKKAVDDDCTKAAASIQGATSGVAVSPPINATTVPQVAIIAPASPVVKVGP